MALLELGGSAPTTSPQTGIDEASARYQRGISGVDRRLTWENTRPVGVETLGPLRVDDRGDLPPRDRTVLAALALEPGRQVPTERLVDALWGELPPPSASKVVQGCISRLRRTLGAEAIETDLTGYRLAVPPESIDHVRFARLIGEGRDLAERGQHERAASTFESAMALWAGSPFPDIVDWEPARGLTARLEELRIEARERRVDALIQAGRHRDVLADARELVDASPTRERGWALLAQAQYACGQQGDALRTLHRARAVLVEELGIDPGAELIQLEAAILRQDPVLDRTAPQAGDAGCPYRGLDPFDVDDSAEFFGRDRELAAAELLLRREGVLLIVGPSGSGKSSLARAGVAAALRREGTRVFVLTATTLADADARSWSRGDVLLVDQLEEVFALEESEREAVFDAVIGHLEVGPVVATLRSDRLGEVTTHPRIARRLRPGIHLIGPMEDDELREAIIGPAERAGLLLEPGLVDLLVRECRTEPGALPLLSYALRETWARREGRTLTVEAYRASGGVQGAISQAGELVYQDLSADEQLALRSIAVRLVVPSDGEPTRRRVRSADLAPDATRADLLETLVSARLLTRDVDSVSLAHEAVARAWPRFQTWLAEDATSAQTLSHLSAQAVTWDEMGRPGSELYRGSRLASALQWRETTRPDLLAVEEQFLDASVAQADSERFAIERRLALQARANRRLRIALAVSACAVVVATLAGALAIRERDRAEASARSADAGRLGALALSVSDVDHSLLLAAQAVRIAESPDTRGSLLTALGRAPALVGSAVLEGPAVALESSPDARWIAVGGPFSGLTVLDADSLATAARADQPASSVSFSPDGDLLAVGTNRYTPVDGMESAPGPALVLYETDGFTPTEAQPAGLGDRLEVPDIDFSDDGRWLAATSRSDDFATQLLVWDLERLDRPAAVIDFDGGEAYRIELAADGSVAYVVVGEQVVGDGRTTRMISLPDGSEIARADVGGDGLDLSDDGAVLAVTDPSDPFTTAVRLLDADTLEELAQFRRPGSTVAALDLSPDGRQLATTDRSSRVTIWDIGGLRVLEELDGHSGGVWSARFSSDGDRVYTAGLDRRMLAWDLAGADRVIPREALPFGRESEAVVPGPDGRYVVSVSGSHLEFADVEAPGGGGTAVPSGHGQIWNLDWHPIEEAEVFTAGDDGQIRRWDARTGELISKHRASTRSIRAIRASSDGSTVFFGTSDGRIGEIDVETGELGREIELEDLVTDLAVQGRRAAVLVESGVVVVDLADGSRSPTMPLGFVPVRGALDPTGRDLAVVGAGGETGLLDLDRQEWIHAPVTVHDDTAFSVNYVEDGSAFVTGGVDGQLVLWEGPTGSPIAGVRPASGPSLMIPVVLDDGTTMVAGSTDLSLYRWRTDTTSLVTQACEIARRELTKTEWFDAVGRTEQEKTCP